MEIYDSSDIVNALIQLPLSLQKVQALVKDLARDEPDLEFDDWAQQWEEATEALATSGLRLRTIKTTIGKDSSEGL